MRFGGKAFLQLSFRVLFYLIRGPSYFYLILLWPLFLCALVFFPFFFFFRNESCLFIIKKKEVSLIFFVVFLDVCIFLIGNKNHFIDV